jgi:lipopolysaccharide transport system ATP-binding protein
MNHDVILEVASLSKRYKLGEHAGTKRLSEAFAGLWRRSGDRRVSRDMVWSLRDVTFEVLRGETVGIIGRNGAGKSTLLKILSRVTPPTEGEAVVKGRVGSLLEVGTGFHPDLTGRENVVLNGALLGMSRTEVLASFDEIVQFAEVERFIDTPVKRYSSGMLVRLGFAVAAHLRTDVLLVDEVLAVGDAAFQERCLGKLGELTQEGRTILFVSHSMGTVRSLCERALLIADGTIVADGSSDEVVEAYLRDVFAQAAQTGQWSPDEPGGGPFRLIRVAARSTSGALRGAFDSRDPIQVDIEYEIVQPIDGLRIVMQVTTRTGEVAFLTTDHGDHPRSSGPGSYRSSCQIPGGLLNRTSYVIHVAADVPGREILAAIQPTVSFSVGGEGNHNSSYPEPWPGVVCPAISWEVDELG